MRSFQFVALSAIVALAAVGSVRAQRERTRPTWNSPTTVSEAQAQELTLTLTEVAVRPIQVWVRTAGVIDSTRRVITASVSRSEGQRIKVGQRGRVFSPESRARMHQVTVSDVSLRGDSVIVTATVAGQALDRTRYFVVEIVTEDDGFLSVPNEAILESDGTQRVYIRAADGQYVPQEITVGLRGERYTQVVEGLSAGQQVVTIGSFFIDAEQRLKGL
jgi:hypothetical protein